MKEFPLYDKLDNLDTLCRGCAHYCKIRPGRTGICNTKRNVDGRLLSLNYGRLASAAIDPIEKKPFYHFLPGTKAFSIGLPGCNFSCKGCQNIGIATFDEQYARAYGYTSPVAVARKAIESGCRSIAYTYSEPTIFFDYARDVVRSCRSIPGGNSMKHVFISNGYFSDEVIDIIRDEKLFDAINIDLKFIDRAMYRKYCGASPRPVLNSIRRLHTECPDIMLEIINLVIPDMNDSPEAIEELCRTIADISPDIPLHFSRFFPSGNIPQGSATDIEALLWAYDCAKRSGLEYVYIGNAQLDGKSDTYCPECGHPVLHRNAYNIPVTDFVENSPGVPLCPQCSTTLNILTK